MSVVRETMLMVMADDSVVSRSRRGADKAVSVHRPNAVKMMMMITTDVRRGSSHGIGGVMVTMAVVFRIIYKHIGAGWPRWEVVAVAERR